MTLVPPVQFTVRPSAGDATLLMVSVHFGRLYGSTTTGSPKSGRQPADPRADLKGLTCSAERSVATHTTRCGWSWRTPITFGISSPLRRHSWVFINPTPDAGKMTWSHTKVVPVGSAINGLRFVSLFMAS